MDRLMKEGPRTSEGGLGQRQLDSLGASSWHVIWYEVLRLASRKMQ